MDQPTNPYTTLHQTPTYILTSSSTPTSLSLTIQIPISFPISPSSPTSTSSNPSSHKLYHKKLTKLSQIGIIEHYCDDFREVQEYLRDVGNFYVEIGGNKGERKGEDKGEGEGVEMIVLGRNFVKVGKVVELGRIWFQYVGTVLAGEVQNKENSLSQIIQQNKLLLQHQQTLTKKLTTLQQTITNLQTQLLSTKQSLQSHLQSHPSPTIPSSPPTPSQQYITPSQLSTQLQKLSHLLLKQNLTKFDNNFEAPSIIQSQYQYQGQFGGQGYMGSYQGQGLEETRTSSRMSFAENFIAELNDQRKRVSGFKISKETEVVMEIISQMQQKLGLFMDRTQKKITKLSQSLQSPQFLPNHSSFKKPLQNLQQIHSAISEGIRNVMALSVSAGYPIDITRRFFQEKEVEQEEKENEEEEEERLDWGLFGSCVDEVEKEIMKEEEEVEGIIDVSEEVEKVQKKYLPAKAQKRKKNDKR